MPKPPVKKSGKPAYITAEEVKKTTLESSDFREIKFSHSQRKFFESIKNNAVTICTGPAGTAKTFVSCYAALDLLRLKEHKNIILCKPAVESGDPVGFLPGSLHEKLAPYMKSFLSNMKKIISEEKLKELILKNLVETEALGYMRGDTFDDSIMILDEAQNADLRLLMLFVTRLGRNSRVVICGDTTQWDDRKRRKDLKTFIDIVKDITNISHFEFERSDIVRNPILIKITDNYEKWKVENNKE